MSEQPKAETPTLVIAPDAFADGASWNSRTIEGDLIAGIFGFPDPWLFEQCGLPPELTLALST